MERRELGHRGTWGLQGGGYTGGKAERWESEHNSQALSQELRTMTDTRKLLLMTWQGSDNSVPSQHREQSSVILWNVTTLVIYLSECCWLQDVSVSSSRPVLSELSRSCDRDNSLRSRWFRGRRRCWWSWHGHGLHAGTPGPGRQGPHGDGDQADNQDKNNPWGIYICNATTRFYNRSVNKCLARVRK